MTSQSFNAGVRHLNYKYSSRAVVIVTAEYFRRGER